MSNENNSSRLVITKKKKKRRLKLFLIVSPFLLLLAGVIIYVSSLYNKAEEVVTKSYEDDGREKSELREEKVDPGVDNVSVLFIGVDDSSKRDFQTSRSDALILATLNNEQKKIKLLSIPRDSYVFIPEVGYSTKINHAHAYGGPKATIETVEQFLDVPIDYYIRINFDAFIDVVEALNGIEANVPYEFYEQDSKDKQKAIHLFPGKQLLNGEEALALARTRKLDNDIERGKRQQEIIKAIMDRATAVNSILKYDDILEAVGENMSTNMSFSQMKTFASYGTSRNLSIDTIGLEGDGGFIGELWYYQVYEDSLLNAQRELKENLGLIEPSTESILQSDEMGQQMVK